MGPQHAGDQARRIWRDSVPPTTRHFIVPGYLLEEVFDPTGAGDCFAGGFIGYLAGSAASTWKADHIDEGTAPRRDLRLA